METLQQPEEPTTDEMAAIDSIFTGGDPEVPEKAEDASDPVPSEEPDETEITPETAVDEATEPDIDYELEIPMPDGRDAMKLGELKDKVVELSRTEQQLIERENAIMRERDELTAIMQQVKPEEIPPQVQQKMAEHQAQHLQREHEAMIAAIPEMAEKTGFDKVRESVSRVFEQYGAADVVNQVMDHRLIQMAYDLDRLQTEKQQALETAQQVKKAAKRVGSKPSKRKDSKAELHERVKNSRNDDAKLAYIDQLLEG